MWWVRHVDSLILFGGGIVTTLWAWRWFRRDEPDTGLIEDPRERYRRNMKVVGPLLSGSAIVLILMHSPSSKESRPSPTNEFHPSAPIKWREFTGDGKFSIMLPTDPTYTEEVEETREGQIRIPTWSAGVDKSRLCFGISWIDLPVANPEYGDGVPEGAANVQRLEAQGIYFTRRTPLRVSGYPGLTLDGTAARGSLAVKMTYVWVARRQYLLTRSGYPDAVPGTDQFFSSFKVTSK